jgi:hypothetical protein
MNVNLERKPLSAPECWGGGIALATVALIAFGGMRFAQLRSSLPAPTRYASVSIEPSETLAKLSLVRPRELFDVAGPTHEVQSSDMHPGTSNSASIGSTGAAAPKPPGTDRSAVSIAEWPAGLPTQQHGSETDSQGALTDVTWGLRLSSPLQDTPLANSQRPGMFDQPSVRVDPSFIGNWTDDIGRCRTGRKAPLVISSHAAKTANGECNFGRVAQETTNRWRITAICAAAGGFWRAKIALKLTEPTLTWSSERGTETYMRCKR